MNILETLSGSGLLGQTPLSYVESRASWLPCGTRSGSGHFARTMLDRE